MKEKALREGLMYAPSSYAIRFRYMYSLTPRWGGSYEKMLQYFADVEDSVPLNPIIWSLGGVPVGDFGESLGQSGNYKESVNYLTQALKYSDNVYWLKLRIYYNYKDRNYDDVISDLKVYPAFGKDTEYIERLVDLIEAEREGPESRAASLGWGDFNFF